MAAPDIAKICHNLAKQNLPHCVLCLRTEKLRTLRNSEILGKLLRMVNYGISSAWKRSHRDDRTVCYLCEARLSGAVKVIELLKCSMETKSLISLCNNEEIVGVNLKYTSAHRITSLVVTETLVVSTKPQKIVHCTISDDEESILPDDCPADTGKAEEMRSTRGAKSPVYVEYTDDDVIVVKSDQTETYVINDDDDDDMPLSTVKKTSTANTKKKEISTMQPIPMKDNTSLITVPLRKLLPKSDNFAKTTNKTNNSVALNIGNILQNALTNVHNPLPTFIPSVQSGTVNRINNENIVVCPVPMTPPGNANQNHSPFTSIPTTPQFNTMPQLCVNPQGTPQVSVDPALSNTINNGRKMLAVQGDGNNFVLHEIIEGSDGIQYVPTVPGRIVNGQLEIVDRLTFVNKSVATSQTQVAKNNSLSDDQLKSLRNYLNTVAPSGAIETSKTAVTQTPLTQSQFAKKSVAKKSVAKNAVAKNAVAKNTVVKNAVALENTVVKNAVACASKNGKQDAEKAVKRKIDGDCVSQNQIQPQPKLKNDNIDWEDKIPMDVITYMDATDPTYLTHQPDHEENDKEETVLGIISEVYSEREQAEAVTNLQSILSDVNNVMEDILSCKEGTATVISID